MAPERKESQYANVGETKKTKDYLALKKEEEKIDKAAGKDFSKGK